MSPLWAAGVLAAAVLASVALLAWLWRTPRVQPAVYRHGGWWYREWRRPYMTAVRAAERRYGLVMNRYVEHVVIGVSLYVGRSGLSLVWARPRFDRDPSFDDWTDQALDVVAEHCCDLHNRNCEPPSELCCEDCTEANHPLHPPGEQCIAPDLSGFGERDQSLATHTDAAMRRLTEDT